VAQLDSSAVVVWQTAATPVQEHIDCWVEALQAEHCKEMVRAVSEMEQLADCMLSHFVPELAVAHTCCYLEAVVSYSELQEERR
jgi:hypothetical protein